MKAALGFALILIAGFLLWEVLRGHGADIVNAFRSGGQAGSSGDFGPGAQPGTTPIPFTSTAPTNPPSSGFGAAGGKGSGIPLYPI